jgi:hypothetical protein
MRVLLIGSVLPCNRSSIARKTAMSVVIFLLLTVAAFAALGAVLNVGLK